MHPALPRWVHRPLCSLAPRLAAGLFALLLVQPAQASNRWDLLQWCRSTQPQEQALCEGMLRAALDLTTHTDFTQTRPCFPNDTTLPSLRSELVTWLEEQRVTQQQSGLALLGQAIRERYPCHP